MVLTHHEPLQTNLHNDDDGVRQMCALRTALFLLNPNNAVLQSRRTTLLRSKEVATTSTNDAANLDMGQQLDLSDL